MADNSQNGPVVSPTLVIVICIAGAVVFVIIIAAMYRLCGRVHAEANEDIDGRAWNPNKRYIDQTKYMEEVRWRNNADVWERARKEKRPREGYKRGWFQEHLERQRAKERADWTPGQEVSAEEFLAQVEDNPYQELLGQRVAPATDKWRYSPRKHYRRTHDLVVRDAAEMPQAMLAPHSSESVVLPELKQAQVNNSGVRVTVNDELDDVVDTALPPSSLFPPRQSRMFRSSSIYSGDGLLPSNHLHMVQSSSNYALSGNKDSRVEYGMVD